MSLTSYAVQLLAWGMGSAMAAYLPKRVFNTFGWKWGLNPGPWNAKEHALIVVAYWGSVRARRETAFTFANVLQCYTAYGLGPLSAMELYYGRKINAGWGILFLITTQMIGYGFAGLFRDILVRPPAIYYPGVLPNVSLFNAMHRNPTVTRSSLKFFGIVAVAAFCYEWFPQVIFPLLASLPLICYFGHGNWIAYILGSGYYGFVSWSSYLQTQVSNWIRVWETSVSTGIISRSGSLCTHHFGLTPTLTLEPWLCAGSSIL